MPHAAFDDVVTHLPIESQQPFAQLVASQVGFATQKPLLQYWVSRQAVHEPPPEPQDAWLVPMEHWPFDSQQPVAHVVGPHATFAHWKFTQPCPVPHAAHATPPVPQAAALFPVRQAPWTQQPVGHVADVQDVDELTTHAPSTHFSSEPQAVHESPSWPQRFAFVLPE